MHRLGFTRTPPKLGGIRKVLIALNRTAFENALTQWAETVLGRPLQGDEAPPRLLPWTARRPAAVSTA